MHELVEPSLTVVDGLARVVFLLGVIGVEEAADARMARAIDVKQLPSRLTLHRPQICISGLGSSSLVGSSITVENTSLPYSNLRRSMETAAEMRLGEVPFASGIEQVPDSVEVEKERVAAAAGEKSVVARLDDIRLGAEGDLGVSDDLRPWRSVQARPEPVATSTSTVCLPFCGFENT